MVALGERDSISGNVTFELYPDTREYSEADLIQTGLAPLGDGRPARLFTSIFDAARWPSSFFRGGVKFFFTFVIPLAVMTTFPAEALLGRLAPLTLLFSILGAFVFAPIS